MVYETGLLVGGVGIVSACIAKVKCYVKKNGVWSFGCGFQDKPLQDEDEYDVKVAELGDVKVLYVKPKHANHDHDDD